MGLLQFKYVQFGGRPPSWIEPEVDFHNSVTYAIEHCTAELLIWKIFSTSFYSSLQLPGGTQSCVDRTVRNIWGGHHHRHVTLHVVSDFRYLIPVRNESGSKESVVENWDQISYFLTPCKIRPPDDNREVLCFTAIPFIGSLISLTAQRPPIEFIPEDIAERNSSTQQPCPSLL